MATRHTIFIIDDDAGFRRTLSGILEVKGYLPIAMGLGKTALERVRVDNPTVALIDLKLEDTSGLELLKRLKKCLPAPECIVLTGFATRASAIEAVNLGAYGYLQKPYDVTQLLILIRRAIEKREAETALRESENRYRTLFNCASDAIFIHTLSGDILEVNQVACRRLGYSREELLQMTLAEIATPDEVVSMAHQDERLRRESHWLFEATHQRRDGTSIPVEVSSQMIEYDGGPVVLSIARDISERKRAELELEQHRHHLENLVTARTAELEAANNQLHQEIIERRQAEQALAHQAYELANSNEALEQFAYVASHDLREPLRKIKSYTELLERRYRGQLDEKADKYIAYIVDGAARMQTLITDLLLFSRTGQGELARVSLDLERVLDNVLADLEVAIRESGAVITREPLPAVSADPSQMAQLWQNLIGNAIKFRGQKAPRVHISARRQAEAWLFSVCDNGIGLEPHHAERIFMIFKRLHTRAEYPGTGIGLAICKRIVERHGGRIWVESQPGGGTTFYFTIPGLSDCSKGTT